VQYHLLLPQAVKQAVQHWQFLLQAVKQAVQHCQLLPQAVQLCYWQSRPSAPWLWQQRVGASKHCK
jgi:D-alanyl-D-alanine dipeptidase